MLDLHWSKETRIEKPKFVTESYLPIVRNAFTVIAAPGGVGKTFIGLITALHFLAEHPLSKAYVWASEDPSGVMKDREVAIVSKYMSKGIDFSEATDRICYGHKIHDKFTEKRGGSMRTSDYFSQIKRALIDFDFVMLDPLLNFYGGDSENDNLHVRVFMSAIQAWATDEGKTVVGIHHGRKEDGEIRGASAFIDGSRLVYEIGSEYNAVIAKLKKSNYGVVACDVPLDPFPADEFWAKPERPDNFVNVSYCDKPNGAHGYRRIKVRFDQLPRLAASDGNYSATEFLGGHRTIENSVSGQNLLVLDFDSHTTIDAARRMFAPYEAVIATTKSHQSEKNGVVCDRFRVLLPTETPITLSAEEYRDMYLHLASTIEGIDANCGDMAHMFYGNPNAEIVTISGGSRFDWVPYHRKAKAMKAYAEAEDRDRDEREYREYQVKYVQNPTPDGKRKSRDSFAMDSLSNGNRNRSLFKLVKFAERDGCTPDEIVAETLERVAACNAATPWDMIDGDEVWNTFLRDYKYLKH